MKNGDEDLIDFEDQESDEESNLDEIPSEKRILRTQSYDKSISDLISMIKGDELKLNPDYQRNYIWEDKKASLLVESILLNVPIPVIYAEEDVDGKWHVVDGLQRLHSLNRFFNNEFHLSGLEVLKELNKKKYFELSSKAQRILKNGIIRVVVILQESHPEIKYDIFMRLNRGSVKLTEQELRNCLHRGGFNKLLKDLCSNQNFLNILNLKTPDKRFNDAEMILRFFAVYEAYDHQTEKLAGYRGSMKNFLNTFLEKKKNVSEEELEEARLHFENTIEKVYCVFGKRAFRRLDLGDKKVQVNRAIMDIVMCSFASRDKKTLENKKNDICTALLGVTKDDEEFLSSITNSTSDSRKFKYRLKTWFDLLDKVVLE